MNLRVIREPSRKGGTLGVLFVNDRFLCWTLEDEIREKPGQHVSVWKVAGQSAIPQGRYEIGVWQSPRLQQRVPWLLNVDGFSSIQIHIGNTTQDTRGCLLVGLGRTDNDDRPPRVLTSRIAFEERLMPLLESAVQAGERIWITIENPMSWSA